jgi:hypothetical protein
MKTKTTKEERKGIKMIQFMQKMAGIKEPPGRALKGWRAMSDWDKQNTAAAYKLFGGK